LKQRKVEILNIKQESWRLKSCVIWLSQGDGNTKFFHIYANYRRMHNAIWNIQNDSGDLVNTSYDLENATRIHFQGMFMDDGGTNIGDQVRVIGLYPRMFYEMEGH